MWKVILVLIGLSLALNALVAMWPVWPWVAALLAVWIWVGDRTAPSARALKACVEPVLIGVTIVAGVQLLLNMIDAFRNPDSVGALEYAALTANDVLQRFTKLNSLVVVAATATLWILAFRNRDAQLVTSANSARKRLGKVAAVVATVSSFTFFSEAVSLPTRIDAARQRLRARYVDDVRTQRNTTRETLALTTVDRALRRMNPRQQVYLARLIDEVLKVAPRIDSERTFARWVVEDVPGLPADYGPGTFRHDYSADTPADVLRVRVDRQSELAASAGKFHTETRAAVENLTGEVFSLPKKAARDTLRSRVVEVLLGMVDADIGVAEKLIDDFAGKSVVDEGFKRASSPMIDNLTSRLLARTGVPPASGQTFEQLAASRVKAAVGRASGRFVQATERLVLGRSAPEILSADKRLVELDAAALRAVHGTALGNSATDSVRLGKAISQLDTALPGLKVGSKAASEAAESAIKALSKVF